MTKNEAARSACRQVESVPGFERLSGWTITVARDHYWRVASYMEFEDLLQEAVLVFVNVRRRYTDIGDDGHRASLYRKAFLNRIHDLARTARRRRLWPIPEDYEPVGFNFPLDTVVDFVHILRQVCGGDELATDSLATTARSLGIKIPDQPLRIQQIVREALS